MRTAIKVFVLSLVAGIMLLVDSPGLPSTERQSDEAGIEEAALNYMDGALNADPDRVALGIHCELNKVRPFQLAQAGGQVLLKAGSSRLLEATRGMPEPKESWKTEVSIFETGEGLATARAVSPWFYDLLQLVRVNGSWRIVNVLWESNRLPDGSTYLPTNREAEEPGVRQAALDYIEGYYAGDPVRMERALSPQLNKVRVAVHPTTEGQFLDYSPYPIMIEATRMGGGQLPEEDRKIVISVHDIRHGLASVTIRSSQFLDHVHLAKLNGAWKVVNVLWVPLPASS